MDSFIGKGVYRHGDNNNGKSHRLTQVFQELEAGGRVQTVLRGATILDEGGVDVDEMHVSADEEHNISDELEVDRILSGEADREAGFSDEDIFNDLDDDDGDDSFEAQFDEDLDDDEDDEDLDDDEDEEGLDALEEDLAEKMTIAQDETTALTFGKVIFHRDGDHLVLSARIDDILADAFDTNGGEMFEADLLIRINDGKNKPRMIGMPINPKVFSDDNWHGTV